MGHNNMQMNEQVVRSPRRRTARVRRWVAVTATAMLTVGGSVSLAQPAFAAPADPVVFADQNLEDLVNAKLGQSAGDTITEDQASSITDLDATGAGIVNLGGIEHLTTLNRLILSDNGIADISALAGLTDLTTLSLNNNNVRDISVLANLTDMVALYLTNNRITAVSSLSGLTELSQLNLSGNSITDISPLSGLAKLTFLGLDDNSLTDVSALSGLSNLTTLSLSRQLVDVSSAAAGVSTMNPVVDTAGAPVVVSSTHADFTYSPGAHTWVFTVPGAKTMTWATTVTVGAVSGINFSGTISQRISSIQVVPKEPEIVQAVCMNGDVVYPLITLPDTEGIDYTIDGDVAPGATVTIEAVPADDDHAVYVDPASAWVDASGDHIYATLEVTLETADCSQVPTVTDTPKGPQKLAATGGASPVVGGAAAAALLLTGAAFLLLRRIRLSF